jgi:6-phosphogluconolactonase (cycloisomerase 2 family)
VSKRYDRNVAIHPNGRYLYEVERSYAYVVQYRLLNGGKVKPLRPFVVDAHSHPTAISFHPNGRFAYVSCSHGAICQYRLGRSGRLVLLSPHAVYGNNDPSPLRFDRTGELACVVTDDYGAVDADGRFTRSRVYVYRVRRNGTLSAVKNERIPRIDVGASVVKVSL